MSTAAYALRDSTTMLRRYLVRARRYPLIIYLIGVPVVMLLLFVYVFGGTLGDGIAAGGGREVYANYVTPGILLLAIAGVAQGTAVGVAQDMSEGIIARFRTMAIFRPSVLTGHVLGNLVQMLLALAVVIGVAIAVGFRPTAGVAEWLAAAGLLTLISLAVTWFGVACGLVAKSIESASNLPMPLILLPFMGSGFVPTDSMPGPVAWFAQYQPFTPMMETLRGLLLGGPIGGNAVGAVAWGAGITALCYLWAKRLYRRDPIR
ncbi:ABC transporter permease [Catellatospora sp. KI3]|uniref:ABC transporter permease n=1 Tax=Catellatospora sp. KI3 TaxID=3041620 RepID=UPI0024832C99|nr:ABC transporter permease [Catellatospora sp. KI3]MDI1461593.1 ABC transporter permease [Catellatospora sp. KI3]